MRTCRRREANSASLSKLSVWKQHPPSRAAPAARHSSTESQPVRSWRWRSGGAVRAACKWTPPPSSNCQLWIEKGNSSVPNRPHPGVDRLRSCKGSSGLLWDRHSANLRCVEGVSDPCFLCLTPGGRSRVVVADSRRILWGSFYCGDRRDRFVLLGCYS